MSSSSSSSNNPLTAVLIAAAQSVGKVVVIGAVGFASVLWPNRQHPFLPAASVPALARFSFFVLTLALIYGSTAQSMSVDTIQDYWFLIVAAFVVLAIAYASATCLGLILFSSASTSTRHGRRRPPFPSHYNALKIAATFPNIVALPILIFPSLCEYAVVYNGYMTMGTRHPVHGDENEESWNSTAVLLVDEDPSNTVSVLSSSSPTESLSDQCVATSNAMIFCYFFSWSLVFWLVGYPQLLAISTPTTTIENATNHPTEDTVAVAANETDINTTTTNNEFQDENGTKEEDPQHDDDCWDTTGAISSTTIMATGSTFPNRKDGCRLDLAEILPHPQNRTEDDAAVRSSALEHRILSSLPCPENMDSAQPSAPGSRSTPPTVAASSSSRSLRQQLSTIWTAWVKTLTSPGFLALAAGMITGFIPPLQRALFEKPGGALLFLGDALLTMGQASSAISTMVVAASLVPEGALRRYRDKHTNDGNENDDGSNNTNCDYTIHEGRRDCCDHDGEINDSVHTNTVVTDCVQSRTEPTVSPIRKDRNGSHGNNDENPIMSDPNFGTFRQRRRSSLHNLSSSVRRRSSRMWQSVRPQQQIPTSPFAIKQDMDDFWRVLLWFCGSSLVLSPALVMVLLTTLDCYLPSVLQDVPPLAKLVVIINSGLPGALIVVVLLKSSSSSNNSDRDAAARVVAQVYLPAYLLSIVTIAAWTTLGLYLTVPDEDGLTFCQRQQ